MILLSSFNVPVVFKQKCVTSHPLKLCLSIRYFQTIAPNHNVKIIYHYIWWLSPYPRHHRSLSAHLLLKCWNVSGTSSWRAVLSGHSAAGGRMTELRPYPPFNTHTQTHTHAVTKTQVHTCFHPVTTRYMKWVHTHTHTRTQYCKETHAHTELMDGLSAVRCLSGRAPWVSNPVHSTLFWHRSSWNKFKK